MRRLDESRDTRDQASPFLVICRRPTLTRKIWTLLVPEERRAAFVLFALIVAGMGLEMLGVGMVMPVVWLLTQDDIASKYPQVQPVLSFLGNPGKERLIMFSMFALVAVYAIKALFLGLLAWRQMSFAFGLQQRLSQCLFSLYLRQPYLFHLQRNSAHLIRNVVNDVTLFASHGIVPTVSILTELLVVIGLVGLLLAIEPGAGLIVTAALAAAAGAFHLLTHRHVRRWGFARHHHDGLRIQHLQQGLGGAKDVKVLGRESGFLDQYRLHNVQSARAAGSQQTVQQLPRLWLELLAVMGLAAFMLIMLGRGRAIEAVVPVLGLCAAIAFRLLPSVGRIVGALQSLKYGLPVVDTLYSEQMTLSEPAPARAAAPIRFAHTLELNRVTCTYPGAAEPALRNVSVTIARGECVGFIGASGAGKTTLVDVLLGLIPPDQGQVKVDGVDIATNMRGWQDQIGYVSQSVFLTDDTLRRNVAFGLPDEAIDDVAVERAITHAQLGEFVQALPMGLETMVGERGVRLSGGQRQRIGIARALYHDPAVLVLDEATSALDGETERALMGAVDAMHGSKTIVIVAHRLSTVERCDRLYELQKGRISEHSVLSKLASL
jgi:ABC-type multidrug transport system fused ATPase/permease subunit